MELDFEILLELLSDGWSRHSASSKCTTRTLEDVSVSRSTTGVKYTKTVSYHCFIRNKCLTAFDA